MMYRPRKYWDQRARRQGTHYVGPGGRKALSLRQADRFRDYLQSVTPKHTVDTVLDFGCGPGRLATVIAEMGENYIGVDLSRPAIREARELYPRAKHPRMTFTYLEGDALPLRSESVCLVAAVTVFQHIVADADWELWTAEIRRVLRPDGEVIVIDALHTIEPTADHVRTRPPEAFAGALGRSITSSQQIVEHWAGVLVP
jgi:ubiquinone/menaquinone biosynthesis C-methylase UbiE